MHGVKHMKTSVNNKKICLALPEEHLQALRALAAETCRTVPSYLRQLVKLHLSQVEQDPHNRVS